MERHPIVLIGVRIGCCRRPPGALADAAEANLALKIVVQRLASESTRGNSVMVPGCSRHNEPYVAAIPFSCGERVTVRSGNPYQPQPCRQLPAAPPVAADHRALRRPDQGQRVPEPLGSVLAGFRGEERLRRFLVVADAATWANAADVLDTTCRKSFSWPLRRPELATQAQVPGSRVDLSGQEPGGEGGTAIPPGSPSLLDAERRRARTSRSGDSSPPTRTARFPRHLPSSRGEASPPGHADVPAGLPPAGTRRCPQGAPTVRSTGEAMPFNQRGFSR